MSFSSILDREISADRKSTYLKAFAVWLLFTAGGWLSIPPEFLPLFSHCVGFGFFLMITTRKARWLGAIAIGALIFVALVWRTVPGFWISVVTQVRLWALGRRGLGTDAHGLPRARHPRARPKAAVGFCLHR